MRNWNYFFVCFVCFTLRTFTVSTGYGHGTPLGISVASGKLTLDHSVYFDPNAGKLQNLGVLRYTNLPALSVDDMQVNDLLNLRLIPRSLAANPADQRYLWYWNDPNGIVAASSTNLTIENSEQIAGSTIAPQSLTPTPNLLLAAKVTQSILDEPDSHVLNIYVPSSAPSGVYGVYGRFEAAGYQPSEPLWLMFNNGLDSSVALNAQAAFLAQTVVVPEPSTVMSTLGATAAIALMVRARKKQS